MSSIFINNVSAQYYNNTSVKTPIITNTPISVNNSVGDIYKYNFNTSAINGNFSIRYTDDGLYLYYDDLERIYPLYTGSNYLNSIFLVAYTGSDILVYVFLNENNVFYNNNTYINLNTSNLSNSTFDFNAYVNSYVRTYVQVENYNIMPCRKKFQLVLSNLSVIYDNSSTCSGSADYAFGNTYNWSIYGSNASLKIGNSYFNDIKEISRIEPEITLTQSSNNETINDTTYTVSKDITLNYTVDPSETNDYLYIYSLDEGNSWTTITPINGVISDTFRLKENKHVIARILDKNTYEDIYTFNENIINISQPQTMRNIVVIDNSYLNNGQDKLYSLNVINYNSAKDIQFQLRFSALDQNIIHQPRLTRVKGLIYDTSSNSYVENDNVYIDNLTCSKESLSSTQMVCDGYLRNNFKSGVSRYEFYFDNVDNVLIEYYDNASNDYRIVNYTDTLLKDYDKYYFNMDSDKAYISVDDINQENKEGSVVIPYYFVNNDDLQVKLFDYDYVNSNIVKEYNYISFQDEYYRRFDFKINNNTIPLLTNKKGKYCVTYYPHSEEALNFINLYENNFFAFAVSNTSLFGFIGSEYIFLQDIDCAEEEQVYFYVSKDFKVTFNEIGSSNNLNITDNHFNVITTIDGDFNNSNVYLIDSNNFFDSVKQSIDYFTNPIREILKMIGYFWNSLNIILKMFFIFIFLFIIGLFALKFLL